jgi:hypothetical protein
LYEKKKRKEKQELHWDLQSGGVSSGAGKVLGGCLLLWHPAVSSSQRISLICQQKRKR